MNTAGRDISSHEAGLQKYCLPNLTSQFCKCHTCVHRKVNKYQNGGINQSIFVLKLWTQASEFFTIYDYEFVKLRFTTAETMCEYCVTLQEQRNLLVNKKDVLCIFIMLDLVSSQN